MPESGVNGVIRPVEPEEEVASPDSPEAEPHFEPVVQLPIIEVSTNEEDEEEMIKLRAKLYRYDTSDSPAEWKERGTGEVKLLRHKTKHTVRVVMRRDKTLKICANHFVWPWMELNPNCGSDRAWVWNTFADFADEQPKSQLLAIRFANADNAKLWKEAFEKAKKIVLNECEAYCGKPESDEDGQSDSDNSGSDENETGDTVNSSLKPDKLDQCTNNTNTVESDDKNAEEVSNDLQKLNVKDKE